MWIETIKDIITKIRRWRIKRKLKKIKKEREALRRYRKMLRAQRSKESSPEQ